METLESSLQDVVLKKKEELENNRRIKIEEKHNEKSQNMYGALAVVKGASRFKQKANRKYRIK